MSKIDLNCDLGESLGPWKMGMDEKMLSIVSSANIACGMHAGDPLTMAKTMQNALEDGVNLGAHPGFADLLGFGRRDITLPADELSALVRYQLGAAIGMAASLGAQISHLKLHGALANMCSRDEDMAFTCYQAARSVDPDLPLMVISGTKQAAAAARLGGPVMNEIFADRTYEADGTLTPRSVEGSVLHDPDYVAERMSQMVAKGALLARDGSWIPVAIDTICLHGDTQGAVDLAKAVRKRLEADGHEIAAPKLR